MLETLTSTSLPPLGLNAVTSLSLGGVHFFATLTPTSLPPLGLRGVTSLSLRGVTPTARVCCSSSFLASRVHMWVCAGRSAGVGVARQLSLASPLPVAAVAAAAVAAVALVAVLVAVGSGSAASGCAAEPAFIPGAAVSAVAALVALVAAEAAELKRAAAALAKPPALSPAPTGLVWVCASRSAGGAGVARQLSPASPLPVAAVAAALVAALVSLVAAGAAELKRAAAALAKPPVSANSRHAVLVAVGRGEDGGGSAGWSEGGVSGGRRKSGVGTSRSRPV
jgi:hypothetical protein